MSDAANVKPPNALVRATRSWTANAKRTMSENPDYFAWWYTVKSIALVGAIASTAYYAGKANGLRRRGRE